jgi:hypothetical protein
MPPLVRDPKDSTIRVREQPAALRNLGGFRRRGYVRLGS